MTSPITLILAIIAIAWATSFALQHDAPCQAWNAEGCLYNSWLPALNVENTVDDRCTAWNHGGCVRKEAR